MSVQWKPSWILMAISMMDAGSLHVPDMREARRGVRDILEAMPPDPLDEYWYGLIGPTVYPAFTELYA